MSSTAENALQATASLFNKELEAGDLRLWDRMLYSFSDQAIVWAFEQWQRNGKFFPKPAEILELVRAYGSSAENQVQYCGHCQEGWIAINPEASPADQQVRRCECVMAAIADSKLPAHKCDSACKARHGKGYHTNDVLWLFRRYQRELAVNPKAKPEDFLDELDRKRQSGVAAQDWQHQEITDEDIPF